MGEKLQALRKAKGLTQVAMAKAAGVPLRSYQQWDQGKRTFSFETAVVLAKALGVSLDELARLDLAKGKGKKGGK